MNWTDEVSSQWGLPETELRLILFARYEKKIISSLQAYNCSMQKKIQSSHCFFILLLLVFCSTFLENVDAFVFGAASLLTPVVVFFSGDEVSGSGSGSGYTTEFEFTVTEAPAVGAGRQDQATPLRPASDKATPLKPPSDSAAPLLVSPITLMAVTLLQFWWR